MNSTLSRRRFLRSTFQAGLVVSALPYLAGEVAAAEPFKRTGGPRFPLSLAAYSFRDFFKDIPGGRKKAPAGGKEIDLFQFIDYCADHQCDGAELTAYYFPKEVTNEFLIALKRHAFLRGIAISGSAVGNNFALPKGETLDRQITEVKQWIDRAAVMGAPHIRVFAGAAKGLSDAEARRMCMGALEGCSVYAGAKGIFLGLENHGGIVAEPEGLLEIVRGVKSKWLGINLDTGNFRTADPYADLEKIAPYAVNVQYKVEIQRKGRTESEPSDLPRVVKILREANYQGFVALEYEAAANPWEAVPPVLKRMREMFVTS